MKKNTIKRKIWLDRRVRLQWLRSIKSCNATNQSEAKSLTRLRCFIILAPKLLIAEKYEQRQQILDVLSNIEKRLQSGSYRVKLDFSKVEKIFPGGMLILLAALQSMAKRHPGRISARCPPYSLAAQLLNHFGLCSALRISPSLSRPKDSSVIDWSHLTGTQAAGEEVTMLLDKYRKNTKAEIPEGLFSVLTEGLTNVRHHAYTTQDSISEADQTWWLFSRYAEPTAKSQGSLYIAIYDAGVGIPATMRNKLEVKEIVINLVDKAGELTTLTEGTALDKRLLHIAVTHKRSQTGQPHRGNGLPEMREFVATAQGGRLHIVSGKAQYSFIHGATDGHTDGFRQKFPGTLLLWSLPLRAKETTS